MAPTLARGAALEYVVLALLGQRQRSRDVMPSAEVKTIGALVNLRVLPRVARIRHHAFAAHLRAQHRIVSTEATRGGNNLAHDGARGKLEESRCTVLQPTGASQFGQCGHVPPALHGLCGPSLLHCPGVLSSGQNVPGVPGCRIGHGQLFGSGAAATHSSARSSNLGRAACRTVVQPAGGFGPPVAAAARRVAERASMMPSKGRISSRRAKRLRAAECLQAAAVPSQA